MLTRLMRFPLLAGIAGIISITGSAVFTRLSGASPGAATALRCLFALPILGALVVVDRRCGVPPLSRPARRLAWFSGVLLAGDLILWTQAIREVGAGLATVLGNMQIVVVAALAWAFLGERPRSTWWFAMPTLIVGVALVGGAFAHHSYGPDPPLGIACGAGSAALFAGFLMLLRRGMSIDGAASLTTQGVRIIQPLFECTLSAFVTATALTLVLRDFQLGHNAAASLAWLALLAVTSQVIGWLLISVTLPLLPAAVTSALLLLQPIGTIAVGAAVFGEEPSVSQLIGVGLILLAVAALTTPGVRRHSHRLRRRHPRRRAAAGYRAPR
jgi:drug/metabolite transporter (DMT)-like permease